MTWFYGIGPIGKDKFYCATPVIILLVGDLFTMLENSEEGGPNGSKLTKIKFVSGLTI